MNIKVYGERNSGTRALDQVLRRNSNSRVLPGTAVELDADYLSRIDQAARKIPGCSTLEKLILRESVIDKVFEDGERESLGWKHSSPPLSLLMDVRNICIIFLVKNPYSWLLSLAKKPYHSLLPTCSKFEDFVSCPWITVRRDNAPALFENPVDLWNFKLNSYYAATETVAANACKVFFIKFEDFIHDQEQSVAGVLDVVGRKKGGFEVLREATKGNDRSLGRDLAYYKEYYGNEKWRDSLNSESVARINKSVDPILMEKIGYDYVLS